MLEHLPANLEKKVIEYPTIVTGCGVGGYLAILSALSLHHVIDGEESKGSKITKRPICITFGCPLIGDAAFQKAISERPQWNSRFLNVVAKKDRVASFFSSNTPYKPFGTFLFFMETGSHTLFEDHEAILEVLDKMAIASSSSTINSEMPDYKKDLSSIRKKVLYRGVSESSEFNSNSLMAGITLQFKEVGVLDNNSHDLIGKMKNKQEKMIKSKNVYEPTKKLNDVKISMAYMEWYIKSRRTRGGYYDSYKNGPTKEENKGHQIITTHKVILNLYWKSTVKEKNLMPQKEEAKLRKRWLLSGNNCREMIEPLVIGEYYKKGNKDYLNNRPEHYDLLQQWLSQYNKDNNIPNEPRNKAPNLNIDSCFWAYVEEAWILLKELKNGGSSTNGDDINKKLESFMSDVMCAVKDHMVSSDIFLEGSGLMKWWRDYNAHTQGSCASDFANYMNTGGYKLYK